MCDVCCATTALADTAERGESVFTWDPKPPRKRGLMNNRQAPPFERTADAPADWPKVYVQAESLSPERIAELGARLAGKPHRRRPGAEGPARARFRLDPSVDWSPWVETDCLAGVMCALGVDLAWWGLPDDHPAKARDAAALFDRVASGIRIGWAWSSGLAVGRQLLHAGKPVPARIQALCSALDPRGQGRSPAEAFAAGGPLDGIDPLDAPAWFDGVLDALGRSPRRKQDRRRVVSNKAPA